MLEQILGVTSTVTIDLKTMMVYMTVALVYGLLIGGAYLVICKREQRSISFFLSLVLIPAVVTVVIAIIDGSVARAFSMAGVFTLVRFRSVPGDGKDISMIFLAMAAGLAAGLGYLTVGAAVTVVLCVVIIAVCLGGRMLLNNDHRQLRILIPEDMDYQGVFDDLFKEYTVRYSLERIKTTNMGTLYELTYHVLLKKNINEKKFMDDLRCRNGNLTIIMSRQEPQQAQL